ncbi:DUF1810 domain-containing protein [Flavobacterium plurextorum]|uniref:DUF1810 domain-containing protein n=1 Tax=Flavobacterium TaxID=237 RepID=UPI00214D56FA|nr:MULTISPECIES: DUF1810 domain-containing protein [Flavobacterium]UUW08278.1 DUF1810 domain-containing protein [Flavobacterium plurextorum]
MNLDDGIGRYLSAQENVYQQALDEIKKGKKQSHWMWFVFPQIRGLGFKEYNVYYGLKNLDEAAEYLNHPVLGKRLIEISKALLQQQGKTALEIFGKPDERKLKSSMTLFGLLADAPDYFRQVLEKYYNGEQDEKTLQLIEESGS